MPKLVIAAALPFLLLAACGSGAPPSERNGAVEAGPGGLDNSSASAPEAPGVPVEGGGEPVPPPDAVSHPDGYLPPAPAGPEPANAGSSAADPPATEDEYIRNGQAGR